MKTKNISNLVDDIFYLGAHLKECELTLESFIIVNPNYSPKYEAELIDFLSYILSLWLEYENIKKHWTVIHIQLYGNHNENNTGVCRIVRL